MANDAELILAVAGSRKTQGIIEECRNAELETRILILTYTTNNQNELANRIATFAGNHHSIDIQGWFGFLIKHIVRPFLPYSFAGRKLRGFDFHANPRRFRQTNSPERYLSADGKAFRVHLPQLALKVHQDCKGAWIDRLKRLYDLVYIDEVQDLCGYDLEVLKHLIDSGIKVRMVGDIRQAVIATNPQESKDSPYKFMGIWKWFQELEQKNKLKVTQRCETWRCTADIAQFADSLFDSTWGFDSTKSQNSTVTGHDGVFLVAKRNVRAYQTTFDPLMLRQSANSGRTLPYANEFMNYRASKGLSVQRVCVLPTNDIEKFLKASGRLESQQAAEFYVAVTRAAQSVAIILDAPGLCKIPYWTPQGVVATTVDQGVLVI